MNILCVIPSRLNSTRLPRKALLPIQGKPMIQWTYENAMRNKNLTDVIVATDSEEIAAIIKNIGGKVEMTSAEIPNGSTRAAVIAERYPQMDVVINLQGDEPFVKPDMLTTLIAPYLAGESPEMTTLASPLAEASYHSPAQVKVILDKQQNAIYFSRSPIPHYREQQVVPVYHHKGVYAFRRDFLLKYSTLAATPLELAESLEQLRVIEHGYKIRVCLVNESTLEINTPEEYALAQQFHYVD